MKYYICDSCGEQLEKNYTTLKFLDKEEFDLCEKCYLRWQAYSYNYFFRRRQNIIESRKYA